VKALHKGSTIASFFFVGTASVLTVIISKVYHKETDKLHDLNKIYKNPKARVVIGKDQGNKVAKKMKSLVKKSKK
jgi:phosphotransferase system IIB component